MSADSSETPALRRALDDARARGFLGSQPTDEVVDHARSFVPPIRRAEHILDLGSGGGVPGLVVAAELPAARVTLLDASRRRTDWLARVVARLGWTGRVTVATGQAELLGHDAAWRQAFDAVVARGFAPPLVTAECAAAFLRVGGRLVVSEPPEPVDDRWPSDALDDLGLELMPADDRRRAVLLQVAPCPPEVPRRRLVRGRTS